MIKVYTDGSCLGNPGNGGWAFVIINEKDISYRAGFERNTTNNQMELMAAIKAIEFLDKYNDINLNTDSNYVKMGLLEWSKNWERNGWKTSKGEDVKNKDLWVHMLYLLRKIEHIEIKWVKAHNGNEKNEIVDFQAREYAYLFSKKE